jgi:fatty acid desaturase
MDGIHVRSATKGDACVREIPRLLTKDEIRRLSEIDSRKVMLIFGFELLLVAAAIAVSETWFNPVTYLIAVLIIGTRINGIGALMHDAAHHRIFKNRVLNDVVGEIMAFPTTASMAGYRNSHFSHHRELNSHKDPDWTRHLMLDDYEFPTPQIEFARRVALHFVGFRVKQSIVGFHQNKDTRDIPALTLWLRLAAITGLIAASIAFGFWKGLLLYWLVPLLTVFVGIRYLRGVSEHYAVRREGVLSESRTVLAPAWQLFLIAPWGLNYHLEHHLYPAVPCYNLAAAHRILMTREPYAQAAHITRGGYLSGLSWEMAHAAPGERDKAIAALQQAARPANSSNIGSADLRMAMMNAPPAPMASSAAQTTDC